MNTPQPTNKSSDKAGYILAILIFFLAFIIYQFSYPRSTKINQQSNVQVVEPKEEKKELTGQVVRRTWLDPGREFIESAFYIGDTQVARIKHKNSTGQEILVKSGTIPNGKVKFTDSTNNLYGEEYYSNGKRHGKMKSFTQDHKLYIEAQYRYDHLLTRKEYYGNGTLRMEEILEDGKKSPDGKDFGTGKLYTPKAILKYEWYFNKHSPVAYRRAFNVEGGLVWEAYYDVEGKDIEKEKAISLMPAMP